ncbi:DUF4435 domain-containing protein [Tumebacillus sp. ITR2]|uniref:DUF4435 domain-containing protein n=1 Tax=Tumebacillus amylolyticus TaxID=2801339 RepID=A0ABS1J6M9_9BACL|nr:DUF4435 domain-containing protein [Tumebacillus amylolyticus]MBL0385333.1 DUF4435 domain-containing protein [Tumebacillus amylolyticus]
MAKWTDLRDQILEREVGNLGKRIFLVEGKDDVLCYEAALRSHVGHTEWNTQWSVIDANGKENVLKILKDQPTWVGLVDRDELSDEEVQALQAQYPNLHILPRYCMESYLIVPDELWNMIPSHYRDNFRAGESKFKQMITRDLQKWVRQGVLWSVVNPLQQELISVGFKDHLLDFQIAQDETKIKQKLEEWSSKLDADRLFSTFQTRLEEVLQLPEPVQLTRWVHGKDFWKGRVQPVLRLLMGQRNNWDTPYDIELWQHLKLPGELIPIFQAITQPQ